MIKSDKELLWRPGRLYIPVQRFAWAYNATGAAGVKVVGAGTPSATNLAFTEIGTTGVVGVVMEAAGDSAMGNTQLPYDVDRAHPIYLRVHWSSGSTDTADTITWLVQYTAIVPNTTAIIDPATALSTVIAVDTVPVATANIWCATEWGKINGNTLAKNVEAITFEVEMDAFAVGLSEAKHLLGLEIAYTPKKLQGVDGMKQQAKMATYMLGNAFSN